MIYLDYCSTTPIDDEILRLYVKLEKENFFNSNSIHNGGIRSKELIVKATKQIAYFLNINYDEIIYTSGATEGNNLAVLGSLDLTRKKRIITTKIEHVSVLNIFKYLSSIGFDVKFINVDKNGKIDENQLLNYINEETQLVSIGHVNNEIGTIQDITRIADKVKDINRNVIVHSDMAQSIGKSEINLKSIDLATFSCHKFFGPKSSGILYKKRNITINPLMYGSRIQGGLRPGTLDSSLIAASALAIRKAFENRKYYTYVCKLNSIFSDFIYANKFLTLNVNNKDIDNISPYIINFRLTEEKLNSEIVINFFNRHSIYFGSRSACCSRIKDINHVLESIGLDEKQISKSMRICLSHKTTKNEILVFIELFKQFLDTYIV